MTQLDAVLDDIVMGESPRWHEGRLWFCDWGAGEIIRATPGPREVVARVDDRPICIDWLPDGRLLAVSGRRGTLLAGAPDGALTEYADLHAVGPYAWNEVATDRRGHAFVNTIGFEFPGGDPRPGFVAVVSPDGAVRPVADDLMFPNGMLVTPDDRTLIVAESYRSRLTAFDIQPDGALTNRRVWAELDDAVPDGICFDPSGAVWYADVPNRRCGLVREGGELVRTVEADRGCFACVVGDGRLYIVAADWRGPAAATPGRTGRIYAAEL
jgi:sugar lactone lactonase YvrE